jgi:UDP-N-acetylmuramate dehydrogenase
MANFSTLKVGGPADALIRPGSRDELVRLVSCLAEAQIPWRVIGGGSNILVADRGIEGVVIVLGRDFAAIEPLPGDGVHRLLVEAGCSLARLSSWCLEHGLSGLEFVAGIPGTVGGAVMMNAGAWGSEIARVITTVELLDASGRIEQRRLSVDDFCYRGWRQPHHKVVVAGVFALTPEDRGVIAERCHRYVGQRAAKQPKGVASAGSFFKNPPGDSAGRLIDQTGLKGVRIGDAEVSAVHANFLVNRGQARAADLFGLMQLVQKRVRDRFGVELQPEVEFVGRW